MKYRKGRDRGNRDDNENLRGLLREQEKENRALKQRIRYLEKQLFFADSIIENNEVEEKEIVNKKHLSCNSCNSHDVKIIILPKKNGELKLLVCQECQHREKIQK